MRKTRKKRLFSLAISFIMLFSLTANFQCYDTSAANNDKVFDLVEITDFHGTLVDSNNPPNQVGAVLSDRVKKVRAGNPDRTIVIGGGDLYQGSAVSNILKGVPVQQVMSNLGMEVTALGNHEFDWGLDTIINTTMKDAKYSIICSNLYHKGTKNRVFEPYKIITKDGVRIAFIGAITNETPSIVLPAYIKDFDFTDAAAEINSVASDIKNNKKADVIIAVLHEGDNGDNATGPIFDITNKLQNVNAVFGGHSHTKVFAKGANGIPIYIGNSNGKGYIDAKMTVSSNGAVSFPTPSSSDYIALDNADGYKTANPVVDADAKAIIDAATAQVAPITNVVIGHTSNILTRNQDNSPYGSSYLGKWAADVVKNAVGASVGLQNNGGLRCDIPVGDITVGTMWQFMPFDNTIYKLSMNKSQLKAVLEQAVMDSGKGIQVSGIKFFYDATASSGNRVYNIVREDGSTISDSEIITVGVPDFMATGGDNFTALKEAGGNNPTNDSHILVRDALINNVKTNIDKNPSIITSADSRIINEKNPSNKTATISVLATSDIHGNVLNYDYATGKAPSKPQGLAKVSTYVKAVRAANPNVMLVDNGDTIQGTPLVYYYNMIDKNTTYPMSIVMGAMGYETWTLGNHEFNYGLDTLNRIMADSKARGIHVLAANAYKTDGTNFVEPYYIKQFNVNGKIIKVGILGLTNKCIPNWEDPSHYAGLHFNDLVAEAKLWVPKVRAAGADIVIITAHSGEESSSDVIPENQIKALATGVSGIDAIVAGHVHNTVNDLSLKNPEGKIVPVVEPNKWGTYVSQIDINIDQNGAIDGLTTKNVAMDDSIAEDQQIVNLIKPYQDVTLKYIQTKIGISTGEFTGIDQTTKTTAIMELINKVQKEAAGTQLSIAAPLSSSAYIPQGDVTIQNIMSVYVYENFLFGVKMTGKQLKNWMEYSVRYYKQVANPSDPVVKDPTLNIPDYNLDQLYGATYDIDLTQPYGQRIKNLKYNGKLIKDTDVYTVAINNYRYNGGGGFMQAAGISNTDPSLVTYDSAKALGDDGQVRSLMISYIQKHGTITPDCTDNWKIYTTTVNEDEKITRIKLDKHLLILKKGQQDKLVALGLPNNKPLTNVIWSTSSEKIATVKDGVVTAIKKGVAVITVRTSDGKYKDKAIIIVYDTKHKKVSAYNNIFSSFEYMDIYYKLKL